MSVRGCDVLGIEYADYTVGASFYTPPKVQQQYLLIKVNNALQVAAKGAKDAGYGSTGDVVSQFLPATLQGVVYSKMKDEIAKGFKEKGVDADIQVVSAPPTEGETRRDLLTGTVLGVVLVGLGWLVKRLVTR